MHRCFFALDHGLQIVRPSAFIGKSPPWRIPKDLQVATRGDLAGEQLGLPRPGVGPFVSPNPNERSLGRSPRLPFTKAGGYAQYREIQNIMEFPYSTGERKNDESCVFINPWFPPVESLAQRDPTVIHPEFGPPITPPPLP